jgi:hypothetical protein
MLFAFIMLFFCAAWENHFAVRRVAGGALTENFQRGIVQIVQPELEIEKVCQMRPYHHKKSYQKPLG